MKISNNSLLTKKEKIKLSTIKTTKKEISLNFTLAFEETIEIKKINKPSMQIGYAFQLLFLKNFGQKIPLDIKRIPFEIVDYIAEQLEIKYFNFELYLETETTRKRHFRQIKDSLGFSKFQLTEEILNIIDNLTFRLSSNEDIILQFLANLKRLRIVAPSLSTIENIIYSSLKRSEEKIYEKILKQLQNREKLAILLESYKKEESLYAELKSTSVNISSNGAKELLDKIKIIDELDCNCDVSFLSEEKLLYFSSDIQKSSRSRIMRFSNLNKKDTYLALFLYFRRKNFVDMVIEVTSLYAHKILKRSRKKLQKYNAENYQNYRSNSDKLKEIINDIIHIEEIEDFKKYKKSLVLLQNELNFQEDDMNDIDFILKSHHSFNYTNELLECIKFDSNTKPELLNFLSSFPLFKNKKKLEIDASFFSLQWQKYIKKYNYSKKIIEIALLYTIRDNIRSGDIFVRESGKYNSFEHYLIESTEINDEYEPVKLLNKIKSSFVFPENFNFSLEFEKDEKTYFSDKIYNYFPKITMAEMIYEVNSWTNFLDDFKESTETDVSEKQKYIVATLLANGHNIGVFQNVCIKLYK